MIYAPVFIPTLHRHSHFKQCLDSLESCTGAEYTDVYIGLDYPPSEKYVEGWKKIDEYLSNKELKNGFHSLTVFRRDHNCGMTSWNSNYSLLHRYVRSISDRYIFSEDDNVFSPNFLEYINKGLDKYATDDSVFAIVGYAHPYQFKCADNNHYRHNTDMSVWGYGSWFNKYTKSWMFYNGKNAQIRFSLKSVFKTLRHGWLRLYQYLMLTQWKGRTAITDSAMTVYMIVTDRCVITPTISKVRNIGWDTEGRSFRNGMQGKEQIAQRHSLQPIDTAEHFEYVGDDHTYMDYNNRVAVRESDGYMSFGMFVKNMCASLRRKLAKTKSDVTK